MRRVEAFAPGHVTGFFAIHDSHAEPIRRGSRGAGFCTGLGATVSVEPAQRDVMLLGGERAHVRVVERAVDAVRGPTDDDRLMVSIRPELPIAQGFGMSGAMALAAALAAAELLDSDVDPVAAAHEADVLQRTGLGDVVAQASGGFEVRTAPGGPPHGGIRRLDMEVNDISLVVLGPDLPTKKVLTDASAREAISRHGDSAVDAFLADPTVDAFCAISREFARSTGLVSSAVAAWTGPRPRSSMCMLGNSAFAFERVPGAIVTSIGGPAGVIENPR
ncbi:MAG: sugar kinase [Thermoplasmata archaeon]|nr:sugar kinase [Thermoplasmata archaeon]